jgi:hypothetical protein
LISWMYSGPVGGSELLVGERGMKWDGMGAALAPFRCLRDIGGAAHVGGPRARWQCARTTCWGAALLLLGVLVDLLQGSVQGALQLLRPVAVDRGYKTIVAEDARAASTLRGGSTSSFPMS